MFFQSIPLMTVIDLAVIAMIAYGFVLVSRVRNLLQPQSMPRMSWAIHAGLAVFGLLYSLDLMAMHVLPHFTSDTALMGFMRELHLEYIWFALPLAIGAIMVGLHLNARVFRSMFESFRHSESRFQDFAIASSDWFWELGPDLKFTYVSDRFFNDMQLSGSTRIGKSPREVLGHSSTICSAEAIDELMATLTARLPVRNFDYAYRGDDGSIKFCRASAVPFFSPDGEFKGYRGSSSDTTMTKQAEIRLAESEALFRGIVEHTPASINLKNTDGTFLFATRRFAEQFDTTPEQLVGKNVFDFFTEEKASEFRSHDAEVERTRQSVTRETEVPFADGTIHNILSTKFPVYDADGQLTSIGSIGVDISTLKQRDAELSEKSALLQTILDTVPGRISILDNDNRMLFANKLFSDLHAKPVGELQGKTLREIHGGPYPEQYDRFIDDIRETGKLVSVPRYKSTLHPGRTQWVLGAPIVEQDGRNLGVLVISIDTTEQQRAEDQLRQSQKMEVVGQLTGGVAHDFNNLLAVIIGNLDLMAAMMSEDDPLQVLIRESRTAAMHGGKLNDRLLAFSRQQSLSPVVMNPNDHITSILGMLRRTLGETITINANLSEELWTVDVDPALLETALLNLAVNARDAMPDGGTLMIATANQQLDSGHVVLQGQMTPGDYIVVTLSDTGAGMDEDSQQRAFEPFFTTKDAGAGTGLGLSMVFGFAKQAGGLVMLDSSPGVGTTVSVYLPRARRTIQVASKPKVSTPRGRGETILLIEDDPVLRPLYARIVGGLGYNVLQAGNGETALKIANDTNTIDLVLSDVVLPGGMSGPQVASKICARRPDIKYLYMSGYPRDMVARQNALGDQIPIVRKPFKTAEVAARLRDLLDTQILVH